LPGIPPTAVGGLFIQTAYLTRGCCVWNTTNRSWYFLSFHPAN